MIWALEEAIKSSKVFILVMVWVSGAAQAMVSASDPFCPKDRNFIIEINTEKRDAWQSVCVGYIKITEIGPYLFNAFSVTNQSDKTVKVKSLTIRDINYITGKGISQFIGNTHKSEKSEIMEYYFSNDVYIKPEDNMVISKFIIRSLLM